MKQFIAFDIGGTNIKYGVLNENFDILMKEKIPTQAQLGGLSIINRIIKKIEDVRKQYVLAGVAISSAGVINPYSGQVINATEAIPNYIGLQIKKEIKQQTGLQTEVLNDVNCFALCEKKFGNAKDCENFITLTIGTGIGGAIYLNNKMYYGNNYSAGEFGRMMINGKKFEAVASFTGLIQLANKMIKKKEWTGEEIFKLYDSGEIKAKEVIQTFYDHLATGIGNLIYIFNPQKVLIGGGITGRGKQFLDELNQVIKSKIDPGFIAYTSISLTKFNNDSGMIGALVHYLNRNYI